MHKFCIAGTGILFQETEPPRPFLEAALQGSSHQLSQDLLQQVIRCLNIDMGAGRQQSREALLRIIANFVFNGRDGQADLVGDILKGDQAQPKPSVAQLLQDPIFEAAWDEMPADEQFEFPDIKKEKVRGRVVRHLAHRAVSGSKRTRNGRPLRQRRARGEQVGVGGQGLVVDEQGQGAQGNRDEPLEAAPIPQRQARVDEQEQGAQGSRAEPLEVAPIPQRQVRVGRGEREPRGIPWGRERHGRPPFVIARTHADGLLKAITVTCNLHHVDGRCNKSLSLGVHFTEAEAVHRIKEWCVRGMQIPDGAGAKQRHMDPANCNPRLMGAEDLRSLEELEAAVA